MMYQSLPYIALLGFMNGSSIIAVRFSMGEFEPVSFIALRFAIAAIIHLIIYAVIKKKKWPINKWLWIHALFLGIVGTVIPLTGIVMALTQLSSGIVAILITTIPAFTIFFAHFFLDDERLSLRIVTGVGLALAGAVLLILRGETGLADQTSGSMMGYVFLLGPLIFLSGSMVYARKYMKKYDSFDVASIRMFSAALFMIPFTLLTVSFDLSRVSTVGYGTLGYVAVIGTFGAMMLAFYNIKRFGATASSMMAYVVPVVASLGGILLLDEVFTKGMLVGTALIILGIYITNNRQQSHKGSQQSPIKNTLPDVNQTRSQN